MVAVPQQQQQQAQASAMTQWMNGPNSEATPAVSGHPSAPPQTHMALNPASSGQVPPRPPGMLSTGPENFGPPLPMQFRSEVPPQTGQQFMPPGSQQFRPMAQGIPPPNIGTAPYAPPQPVQYPPQMQHLPPRPGQQQQTPASSQTPLMTCLQQPRPMTSWALSQQPQQSQQPLSMPPPPGLGGMGLQPSSSYTCAPSTFGQSQNPYGVNPQYQAVYQPQYMPQVHSGTQQWGSVNQNSVPASQGMQTGQQSAVGFASGPRAVVQPGNSNLQSSSDWQEHTATDGRRYYFKKKTKESSWEKPLELMTPIEREEAFASAPGAVVQPGNSNLQSSSDWKEHTSKEGTRYYFNKKTRESSWEKPLELMTPIERAEAFASAPGAVVQPGNSNLQNSSDWKEHTSKEGRRYYFNKKSKERCWEKPLELMTPIERAGASTGWKEFTTSEGRKYYYNKVTKQSEWIIPDEMKMAREQAEKTANSVGNSEGSLSTSGTLVQVAVTSSPSKESPNLSAPSISVSPTVLASTGTPTVVAPVMPLLPANPVSVMASLTPRISTSAGAVSTAMTTSVLTASPAIGVVPSITAAEVPLATTASLTPTAVVPATNAVPTSLAETAIAATLSNTDKTNGGDLTEGGTDEASAQDLEEAKKAIPVTGKVNSTPLSEEKAVVEEPLIYANKIEAKNVFKELLDSAHVEVDWTWEQALRVIINDKRYGALKTIGERVQAFNEYLAQRQKHEAEERRIRQKRAREDFVRMLGECKELTSATRWTKAVTLFENDARFLAVERERERQELCESYLIQLERKERDKAREERKSNLVEYRAYLESCDFIKANTQWREVQGRLEDTERCSRLDKIDRLEMFQEYIGDLQKEEEEEKRIQKEQLRRKERKNRDEFRKLMEEHGASGILTAKTDWRDYCHNVKDCPAYVAVASNTSGLTPKELFEDVAEELEKQYHEDKERIKDAMKAGKFKITSAWNFDEFKASLAEACDLAAVSESNLKLVFEEVMERTRENEEKDVKKRQREAELFTCLLYSVKEITASSRWEDCKSLLEDAPEYKSINDEGFQREIFDDYIAHLQEKFKEKERKREEEKAKKEEEREKQKEKERDKQKKEKEKEEKEREKQKEKEKEKKEREKQKKEKEKEEKEREKQKEREKEDEDKGKERDREKAKDRSRSENDFVSGNVDVVNNHVQKEERRKDRDREKESGRKHKRRHASITEDVSSVEEKREESKKSRRHTGDRNRSSRKHRYESDSDSENRHKRYRRDRDRDA